MRTVRGHWLSPYELESNTGKYYVVNYKCWKSTTKGFYMLQQNAKGDWYIQQAFPYEQDESLLPDK